MLGTNEERRARFRAVTSRSTIGFKGGTEVDGLDPPRCTAGACVSPSGQLYFNLNFDPVYTSIVASECPPRPASSHGIAERVLDSFRTKVEGGSQEVGVLPVRDILCTQLPSPPLNLFGRDTLRFDSSSLPSVLPHQPQSPQGNVDRSGCHENGSCDRTRDVVRCGIGWRSSQHEAKERSKTTGNSRRMICVPAGVSSAKLHAQIQG